MTEVQPQSLAQWCPHVDLNAPWSERCGAHTRLGDGKGHRCYLKVDHPLTHVCSCGRDLEEEVGALTSPEPRPGRCR